MLMGRLSPEQSALRDMAAALAAERFAPRTAEWDQTASPLPDADRRFLGELGLLGITHPSQYGGSDRPLIDALIALEEIGKECPMAAWPIFEACTGAARVVQLLGTDEQRGRFLPPVIAGEKTIAVAISEPEAGSAATDMRTKGRIEGHGLVINGVKRWCSGAGHSEQYLVYLRLSDAPGAKAIGAVMVDRDTPGLTFGARERLMGFRGVPSADMHFDEVRVPVENIIVGAGNFNRLFAAFSIERLGNATMSLATGQAALDRTARYVKERAQFGRRIASFQLVQSAIAEMVVEVQSARLLVWQAALEADRGVPSAMSASIAKYRANEMAKTVCDLAMQLHGGYGYSAEYPIERLHRDAQGWAVAGGTINMQRIRIASEYLGVKVNHRADSAAVEPVTSP
jgi:alkylation response protein AidB-like acyl-CoA dehydrogenase